MKRKNSRRTEDEVKSKTMTKKSKIDDDKYNSRVIDDNKYSGKNNKNTKGKIDTKIHKTGKADRESKEEKKYNDEDNEDESSGEDELDDEKLNLPNLGDHESDELDEIDDYAEDENKRNDEKEEGDEEVDEDEEEEEEGDEEEEEEKKNYKEILTTKIPKISIPTTLLIAREKLWVEFRKSIGRAKCTELLKARVEKMTDQECKDFLVLAEKKRKENRINNTKARQDRRKEYQEIIETKKKQIELFPLQRKLFAELWAQSSVIPVYIRTSFGPKLRKRPEYYPSFYHPGYEVDMRYLPLELMAIHRKPNFDSFDFSKQFIHDGTYRALFERRALLKFKKDKVIDSILFEHGTNKPIPNSLTFYASDPVEFLLDENKDKNGIGLEIQWSKTTSDKSCNYYKPKHDDVDSMPRRRRYWYYRMQDKYCDYTREGGKIDMFVANRSWAVLNFCLFKAKLIFDICKIVLQYVDDFDENGKLLFT